MSKINDTVAKICDEFKSFINCMNNSGSQPTDIAFCSLRNNIADIIEKATKSEKSEPKIYADNIQWDADECDDISALPTTVEIPNEFITETIGEYLSDEYGFCHNGWTLKTER